MTKTLKGFKKTGKRIATAEITDVKGWTISKGQKFIVLEIKVKRPSGFPINIAIDNGFSESMFPLTAIDEDDFNNLSKEIE
jgi:hypothetical protein